MHFREAETIVILTEHKIGTDATLIILTEHKVDRLLTEHMQKKN